MALIKTPEQIKKMEEAGRIVARVHRELKAMIAPGVTLLELDKKAEEIIRSEGAIPTFKGFDGFPGSICASINEEMVHGIPTERQLKDGDIISVDVGALKDGWNGDAAFTMAVGTIPASTQKLLDVTKEALAAGIKFAKPGVTLGELGAEIESYAIKHGYTAARDFVGHGIGEQMHEEPYVPNYGFKGGMTLQEGMTICIEPMFIDGKDQLFIDPIDKWTVRSKNGDLTTHDEHTIVIEKNGGRILTKE